MFPNGGRPARLDLQTINASLVNQTRLLDNVSGPRLRFSFFLRGEQIDPGLTAA